MYTSGLRVEYIFSRFYGIAGKRYLILYVWLVSFDGKLTVVQWAVRVPTKINFVGSRLTSAYSYGLFLA